jgi:predicted Rossmann fold flavoprotein
MTQADIIIIGAGAAGLAAAIFAGEATPRGERRAGRRILLLDGAKSPGAKILVAGGGRCNVTHERVTPEDYCGGPRPIIRNVLRAFGEQRTLEWMAALGVPLKLEPTGKYFPVSNQARTVLEALFRRVREVGVEMLFQTRVTGVRQGAEGFQARRLILATGGLALPKSGSDGAGLAMARRLGHSVIPTTPALSPLVLRPGPGPGGRFEELSGVTVEVRLGLYAPEGQRIEERTGSMVFTHFGVSGPAALDLSRHILRARLEHPETAFQVCLGHPALATVEEADNWLKRQVERQPRRAVWLAVNELWPERLARILAEGLGEDLAHLSRENRLELARRLARLPLEVTGDRGYAFAETTAGGVDLREVDARTMASRKAPGLYLCGEILDVDGRIGGFNFQWAWASGYLAGRAAAGSLGE